MESLPQASIGFKYFSLPSTNLTHGAAEKLCLTGEGIIERASLSQERKYVSSLFLHLLLFTDCFAQFRPLNK
jgi:hypothetical protein